MVDFLQWGTFGASAVAAGGGTWAALATRRSTRLENQRTWERDRVTERYTAFIHSLEAIDKAYTDHVLPLLRGHPVPQLHEAWLKVDAAHAVFNSCSSEFAVIARPFALRLYVECCKFDARVLAPYTTPAGIPAIARQRVESERHYLLSLAAVFVAAMRADLGLSSKGQVATLNESISRLSAEAQVSRSPFVTASLPEVIRALNAYQVTGLVGADENYLMPDEFFNEYCALLPAALGARGIDALLIVADDGAILTAGVRSEIPADVREKRLRQIGKFIEKAGRSDAGTEGWRLLPDGAQASVWTSDNR